MTLETGSLQKLIDLRFCQANKIVLIIYFQAFLGSSGIIQGINYSSLNQLYTLGKVDLKKIHNLCDMLLEL